jgi:flagellum-specific peptidoglycan hydrolase FlgJ
MACKIPDIRDLTDFHEDAMLGYPLGKASLFIHPTGKTDTKDRVVIEKFQHAKQRMAPVVAQAVLRKAIHESPTAIFLKKAILAAQKSEKETGVPASITVAQACVESAWGKLFFGPEVNNYFGIKADPIHGVPNVGKIATGWGMEPTKEEITNKDGERIMVPKIAPFRTYKNMADSFTDHGSFLVANPKYRPILNAYAKTGDADVFAKGLQACGYATASNYAATLTKIMQQKNLYQYYLVKRSQGLLSLTK